jgi:hypothetical protein
VPEHDQGQDDSKQLVINIFCAVEDCAAILCIDGVYEPHRDEYLHLDLRQYLEATLLLVNVGQKCIFQRRQKRYNPDTVSRNRPKITSQ